MVAIGLIEVVYESIRKVYKEVLAQKTMNNTNKVSSPQRATQSEGVVTEQKLQVKHTFKKGLVKPIEVKLYIDGLNYWIEVNGCQETPKQNIPNYEVAQ